MATYTFHFGFEGDDIEEDPAEKPPLSSLPENSRTDEELLQNNMKRIDASFNEPKLHSLEDLLSTLPSRVSYSLVDIERQDQKVIKLPRRELFDIRAQLMAEDAGFERSSVMGLSADDIMPRIYEGGFKTWECSVDLARYLAGRADIIDSVRCQQLHVIELGAGTALPSLILLKFRSNLIHSISSSRPTFRLTLADYNDCVLQLATIPNALLTWVLGSSDRVTSGDGDLEISPADHQNFKVSLAKHNIEISTISGAWGPKFVELVSSEAPPISSSPSCPKLRQETLVLASETIYSPSTIDSFVSTLLDLLAAAEAQGRTAKALIAAKKVYFGIGGGVDDFIAALQERGGQARIVWELEGEGVDREILEVRGSIK